MNLPTVKPLSVVKNVDYKGHYSTDYDKQTTGGQIYQFEIQELINGEYQPASFDGVIARGMSIGMTADLPTVPIMVMITSRGFTVYLFSC